MALGHPIPTLILPLKRRRVFFEALMDYARCEALSARLKSSTKSLTFSNPTDNRTVPCVMPADFSAASSMRKWVVLAG